MKSKACSLIVAVVLFWGLQGAYALQVPSFMESVPSGHFAGVSEPCESIAKARRLAIMDVARQVLSSIGMQYDYKASYSAHGNVKNPTRRLDDLVTGKAKGLVMGIDEGIVESVWNKDDSGRYVYFVLVRYPDSQIEEMRRLSKGAMLNASVLKLSKGKARISISEDNGVSVMLNCATVQMHKENLFAGWISYFVVHVPSGSNESYKVGIGPIRLQDSSAVIQVPISGMGIGDYLLGARLTRTVVISGVDEVGRPVRVAIEF